MARRFLLLFPPFFWLLLFFLGPLLLILAFSVARAGDYGGVHPGFTLAHYRQVFEPVYLKVLFGSLATAGLSTLLTLLVGFPMAYHMAFCSGRTRMLLLFLMALPFFTNLMIRLYAMTVLLGDQGWINGLLLHLGLLREPLRIVSTSTAVYLGFLYWNLPFMVFPILASLERLDLAQVEASMDLGAGPARTFLRVTLPCAMPGLFAGVVFCFVPTLGCYIIPEVLGGKNDVLVGNIITQQVTVVRNWPLGSAFSALLLALIMGFVYLYLRYGDRLSRAEA